MAWGTDKVSRARHNLIPRGIMRISVNPTFQDIVGNVDGIGHLPHRSLGPSSARRRHNCPETGSEPRTAASAPKATNKGMKATGAGGKVLFTAGQTERLRERDRTGVEEQQEQEEEEDKQAEANHESFTQV
ncbi:hypothetical protein M406DRAFT_334707 [Cryphonectria parasitica EP155]|uniref:Uncharacterized protein n=1 Tax=Cryphonectria parasitica (strain ATCC 38755 / EP155) TaxID=660469 RepID=A0A9P4XUK9_CRYP1|nr:uncharacterized protein M406DRAFT_334707 [Cryphonectria parasitica EP155]KAF3761097.1 hypothetical protein M406DRAFT_334707 [Cryphonectria parasitica EP155]